MAGASFYLKGGKPKFVHNCFGTMYAVESPEKLGPGKHSIRFNFDYDGGGIGKGGTMTISVDGKTVAKGRVEKTVPICFSMDTVDVGSDHGLPVTDDYTSSSFTGGTLKLVTVALGEREPATDQHHQQKYELAMAKQ